jgi:type IV pilus assembly protein PilE
MVVLVIIGILILLALPSFDGLFMDAYSLEAKTQLKYLHSRQQIYYQRKFSYATDLQQIGFSQPKSILEGGEARYAYEVASTSDGKFTGRATALVDFDKDGIINVWEVDQTGVIVETVPD